MFDLPTVSWQDSQHLTHQAYWYSETHTPIPQQIQIIDATMSAQEAYRLACAGKTLLWKGDFYQARQLVQAMARRIKQHKVDLSQDSVQAFHLFRLARAQRARILGRVVIELEEGYQIRLRRAPDVQKACQHALGKISGAVLLSLQSLLGIIGAYQWHQKGIEIAFLQAKIYPHYGVFFPSRDEYLDLIVNMPLPISCQVAFDIGTGTGVLAAILAKRGISRVIATENNFRAVICAQANMMQLGMTECVTTQHTDLYPEGKADLIVCNPPWMLGKPSSLLETAIYDENSAMLNNVLSQAKNHLNKQGELWLILSNFPELIGLRKPHEILQKIEAAGLKVSEQRMAHPTHSKSKNIHDPLHHLRAAEVTTLWRLSLV